MTSPAAGAAPVAPDLPPWALEPDAAWLAPMRPLFAPLARAWPLSAGAALGAVAQSLNDLAANGTAQRPLLDAGPLQFVRQDQLPAGEPYETFVHRHAQVPTRDNLHDLFNGLVWLSQPALKCRLNALQAGELARQGVGGRRGPLRDALTLMDENGALLQAPQALWTALLARDWPRLFVSQRPLWSQARLTIVGHALLEQLATAPRKALTAHVLCVEPGQAPCIDAGTWAGKPFTPLPVLGVPGWWPDNDDPAFYDDAAVFRQRRGATAAGAATVSGPQAGKKPSMDR